MSEHRHSSETPAPNNQRHSKSSSRRRYGPCFYRATAVLACRLARTRASLARVIGSGPVEMVTRQSRTAWHLPSGIARAATAVNTKL